MRTASALIQVIRDWSGSWAEVSIRSFFTMAMGERLWIQSMYLHKEQGMTNHPLLFIKSSKAV